MTDTAPENLVDGVDNPRGEPRLRAQGLFDRLNGLVRRFDNAVEALIPSRHNPFAQTGAVAIAAFIVSAISGILLLIWYRPTVHQAYESVMAMESIWIGEFLRSLHRYSSDVCIFFVLIHALRLLFAGRFTGARWLAWVTGVGLVVVLWFIGWTGYMLVWDQPAQLVAQGTALFLDGLPIFAEPISRSFLADELVPPLIFFAVFFIHMLLPLLMAAGLWLHVARLQRPKVLTSRWMTLWTVGALVVLSAVFPAAAGEEANLQHAPDSLNIDIWYLAPLWLTDRLSAGMLWTVAVVATVLIVALPWLLRRDPPRTASLNTARCNGCTRCVRDCHYDAIVMVPRSDDRRYELEAKLDPNLCVGCGICAGACNPGGIGLDWLPVQAVRRRVDDWIEKFAEGAEGEEGPVVAFVCSDSAGAQLDVDEETGECAQLPGYRVMRVPCSGWVQPLTVERALRKGAAGVVVVGCSESEPQFREGHRWAKRRLSATREPKLRRDKIDASRVGWMCFDSTRPGAFIEEARAFRHRLNTGDGGAPGEQGDEKSGGRLVAGAVFVAAATSAVIAAGSVAPYPGPPEANPELVVSMNHYGQRDDGECAPPSHDERGEEIDHMAQAGDCDRGRSDVRLEVSIDDQVVYDEEISPRGVGSGGPAITLESLEIDEGERDVRVRVADGPDGQWRHERSWQMNFEPDQRQVVLFDTDEGFRHFSPE